VNILIFITGKRKNYCKSTKKETVFDEHHLSLTVPVRGTPRQGGAGSPLKRRGKLKYSISTLSPPFKRRGITLRA